jgi:hypothetical protein
MVQVIPAQNITLAYLKENFALEKSEDQQFFTEWFDSLPEISELEQQYLDRVKRYPLNSSGEGIIRASMTNPRD